MEINFELLYRFVIAVDILLCAAIILANLLLLLSILSSRQARARTRNVMLVSVCLADLLVGAFTHPIYIHSYHTGTLFHSCEMHILMQLIGDYSQDFVCFWTLVTLGTVSVYGLAGERWGWGRGQGHYDRLSPAPSRCHACLRLAKKALLVGWPWLGTLLIPIPILMATVEQSTRDAFWDETFCPLHTPFPSRMVVLVLVFYLPMAALLLLCVGLALLVYWDTVHAKPTASAPTSAGPHGEGLEERPGGEGEGSDGEGRAGGRGGGMANHGRLSADDSAHPARDGDAARPPPRADPAGPTPDPPILTHDTDPSVILVGGGGGGGGGERGRECGGECAERPGQVLVPLLVTVVCALPLMVGWWFYRQMPHSAVILVSVTLSRVYLLRAALLPLAWFSLPDLRRAAADLCGRLNGRGRPEGETWRAAGEFSVAYTTLRESSEAPSDGEEAREARRHNPFDPNFVRV